MNIGIIGSGHVGSTVAELFDKAGHYVAISHSGDPQEIASLASSLGPHVTAKTTEDAVKFGDIVLLAIPWIKRKELPNASLFEDKVTIDATNPYSPQRDIIDLGDSTSSEEVLKVIPGSRLVKAFNSLNYELMRNNARPSAPLPARAVLFVAGDDSKAKEVVAKLIEDIGFAAVDTGFLREGGRLQQPGSPIYNVLMTFEEAKQRLDNLP
ncbi:MAG: NADPH-dependent F420 reductase [Ktedonobacteraceae bacterium]